MMHHIRLTAPSQQDGRPRSVNPYVFASNVVSVIILYTDEILDKAQAAAWTLLASARPAV